MASVTFLPGVDPGRTVTRWPTFAPTKRRFRAARLFGPPEITILTLLALSLYVASSLWVRFSLHYWINDALNRTDDALYVTVGRDPHLGAIGFYWPPLPQLLQIPLVPLLRPFGEEILAGPFMSSLCMAATIPVLAKLGQRLSLRRPTTLAICLVFAVTPDMVYSASNGMAEACFVLSGAVTMLGFLTWIESHSTADMLVFGLGLSMLVMTRLEGPFIAISVVVVAVFHPRRLRRSLWDAFALMLPPAFFYGLWVAVQWILLKDPLFFLHQNGGGGPAVGTSFWLPPNLYQHPLNCVAWVLGWVGVLAPVLFVLAAATVAWPLSKRTRGSLGIMAATGAVLAIQAFTAYRGSVFGNPRYFVMAVIFGTVAAVWLASRRRTVLYRAWNLSLVVLLVIAAGTGSYALTSGRITHVERECSYFQYGVAQLVPVLGRAQYGENGCSRPGLGLEAWHQADAWIDTHLTSHDRILADNASNYAASLFSRRPDLFIVRNDRDWAKTIANPLDVTYIMTQSDGPTSRPSAGATYAQDLGASLIALDPEGWHIARAFSGAENLVHGASYVQVWHFVPSQAAGATPRGTQSYLQ